MRFCIYYLLFLFLGLGLGFSERFRSSFSFTSSMTSLEDMKGLAFVMNVSIREGFL